MLAISLGASFPVYAETFTVQTVESDPTHGVVVRQTIAHDYVKRRSMMKAKGLLVQGVLQQIRRCDRQPKGWYAAIGGPNASHLTCTNTSIDLDPAFCQQSPFWAAPPANATSRRVTLNGTACSRWSWWEGGEEFAFWGTPTTPLRAAKIFTAKAGFSTYAIDFTNFVAAPPALSEFDALPGAVCPKATRPERGSAAGLGRWGRRAARAEFSARAVANAATAAAATIAASHAFATGRAYFGSINGTTVATATVSFDRAMHPTLSFDRASHPLVDVHGAVAWIVVPRAPRVAFVGVRSARMSGGGAIVSLPISKTGVLSPTPLSTSPFSPVHFAYEAAWLLACDYGDGYCSTFAVDDREGKVASMSSSVCNFTVPPPAPVNPNPRQASSHPHEANFAPQKRSRRGGGAVGDADALTSLTAFVPDLGGDRVHFLSIDRANGSIRLDAAKSLVFARGAGPRHMVWSPDLAWAYVVCEIISAVAVFPYDAARSEFASTTPAQVISTLAPTHNASEFTKAAEVAVSADGTLLFASNRGNQSIAVFDVDSATGLLALRSLALGVAWPRDISVLGASLLAIERDGGAAGRGAVGVFDIAPGPTGGGLVLPPRESHDVASPASYAYVAL